MEWGNFISVIAALYLAWYGFNFLFDLFVGAKPKVQADSGIQYNITDLISQEEKPQEVNPKDFKEEPVKFRKDETPKESVESEAPTANGNEPNIKVNSEPKPVSESAPKTEEVTEDWADIATRVEDQEQVIEEKIDIPVQGQPVSVTEFIQNLMNEAKEEIADIKF